MSCSSGQVGVLSNESFIFQEIVWKIPNLLSLPKTVDLSVQSPSFRFANAMWRLEIYLNGQTLFGSQGHVDVIIKRIGFVNLEHTVFWKIFFATRHGKEFRSVSSTENFSDIHNVGGLTRYLSQSELETEKNEIAPNGTVTVICGMRTQKIPEYETDSQTGMPEAPERVEMSTETKLSNGTNYNISNPKGTIRCPADAILNGFAYGDIPKNSSEPKHYKSLYEYCNEVADQLPQRQAFYTIDLADILWKIQEWKKSMPKVEIFYAVKANTDPVLLQLLTKLGLSFDCASEGEIQMVLNAGASPSSIILAHTIKSVEGLKFAYEKGVELMTFDNKDELLKIHRVYPNASLLIRICPTSVNCSFDLKDKFGCAENEALELLKLAKQLNLRVVGVSFHVGSLCSDPISYTSTIQTSRRLFDAAQDMGFSFTILDIGGGFFGQSGTENHFYKMADSINKSLEENFNDNEVRIIAEPGTYIACSAGTLVCTVLGRRCFDEEAEGRPRRHYYLSDGVFGSFFRKIECFGIAAKPILPDSEVHSRTKYESRLFGQTCGSEDVIQLNVSLPDLNVGERVIWENMGAYCRGVSSTFCGVPLPVPRYIFAQDQRLSFDWINDKENIKNFLKKCVAFIGSSENCI